MKNKKPNAELVWKQLEDLLVPRLRLSVVDRTVYSHLLRHSRLEGKLRLRFSIRWLGRNIRLSTGSVRAGVRRLVAQGALRLVQRSKLGHVVEVRLPDEIRTVRLNRIESRAAAKEEEVGARAAANLEETDFLRRMALRKAIHRARILRGPGGSSACLPRTPRLRTCRSETSAGLRRSRSRRRTSPGRRAARWCCCCCRLTTTPRAGTRAAWTAGEAQAFGPSGLPQRVAKPRGVTPTSRS